jgi:hypothetical protein
VAYVKAVTFGVIFWFVSRICGRRGAVAVPLGRWWEFSNEFQLAHGPIDLRSASTTLGLGLKIKKTELGLLTLTRRAACRNGSIPIYAWPIWQTKLSPTAGSVYRIWPRERVEVHD